MGHCLPAFDCIKRIIAKHCVAVLAVGVVVAVGLPARAQIAVLDKGHQLLVNQGLQIWGLQTDSSYSLNYNELTAANMNAVVWSYGQSNPGVLAAGQKWGLWVDYHGNPATALNATELAHHSDLVAIQIGDEQQSDIENPAGFTKAWFDAAHAGNYFTNQLLYVNSFFINDHAAYANFITNANPDAISWDGYPFGNPHGGYILPKNWLTLGNIFRRHGLGTYIGATGASPRPYGMYVQTFHDGVAVDPGEVEIRWQQFAAWTMGYEFVDAFIYRGGNNNFGGQSSGPVYLAFQETARQGRNLGPALTKLISYGYGPSFVQGAGSSGMPGEWIGFDRNNAQPSQRYLTAVSNVTNLGTKNGGLSGDVYVGFFNPLHLSFGDPTGTTYFMVMNGLGGDLALPNGQSDNTTTVAETRQQMMLSFDFGVTGINSLLRLNRDSGAVDVINTGFNDGGNTVFTSLGNGKYQLQLKLDGGTGDLFKYNDGTPFVGVQAAPALGYWDNDANAANNNVTSGAGLGGSGNWDTASSKWYNSSGNSTYSANSNVVFAGTAGTVTLTGPKAVTSMQFKSSGYTIAGSTLTLVAPTITTDAGVAATITSSIAGSNGLIKNGPGTLIVNSDTTYSGNTTINEGTLAIANNSSLGGFSSASLQINHGATLRFHANNITLPAAGQVILGSGGGVIDTNGHNDEIAATISGSTLTKTSTGWLTLSGANSHASTSVIGGSILILTDANLGAAPSSFTAGNLTLDGGRLRFRGSFDINNNRGITLGTAGGTIDTQGFSNPLGYNAFQGGFRGPGDLTKLGSGTFFAAATTGGANTTWTGRLIIKEGTWKIVASDGLPYNVVAADPLQPEQVTLDGGTWQIGANMNVANAKRGVTIAAGGGTIDTQTFNFTWAGPWAGNVATAVLNKIGSGQLQLNTTALAPGSFTGTFNINDGTVVLNGGTAMGDSASIQVANAAGVGLTISGGTETIGSLSGGGGTAIGGNVTLSSSLVTGGNNNSTTFQGVLSGSGGLTKTGSGVFTLSATGGNAYSGTTTVSAGTLLVSNTTGSGTGSNSVGVNSGATLGGTGKITGVVTINSGGHLAPGTSIESLDVGSVTFAVGSILDFELGTIMGVDTSDLLNVTNTNGLTVSGGTLNIADVAGMTGGMYTLIDYAGTLNGSVNNLSFGVVPSGFTYSLIHDSIGKTIQLEVTAPGDFNHDGAVDGHDYVVWRKGLNTKYTPADYNVWRAHFGQTYANGAGASPSAVPEPAAWLLMCIGWAMLLGRRGLLSARTAAD